MKLKNNDSKKNQEETAKMKENNKAWYYISFIG